MEVVEHVALLIDRVQDQFEELTEGLLVSVALLTLVRNKEVDIRKVKADRLVGEVLHKLLEEGECDAVALLKVSVASRLRLELAEVQGVHVARYPEVSQELLVVLTQLLGLHLGLYHGVKFVNEGRLAHPIANHYTALLSQVVYGFLIGLVPIGTDEHDVGGDIHALLFLQHEANIGIEVI